MDEATKRSIFEGFELDKLKDFCKNCAEEDKKIHEIRKNNPGEYIEPPVEPEPKPEPIMKPKSFQPPEVINQEEIKSNPSKEEIVRDETKINTIGENDPDPLNARIKGDVFNQRLALFDNKKK